MSSQFGVLNVTFEDILLISSVFLHLRLKMHLLSGCSQWSSRSSHLQMFFKIGVLKNFTKFQKFHKFAGLKACNVIKKRFQHRRFPVKFTKLKEHLILQSTSGGCFWSRLYTTSFYKDLSSLSKDEPSLNLLFHLRQE